MSESKIEEIALEEKTVAVEVVNGNEAPTPAANANGDASQVKIVLFWTAVLKGDKVL